MMRCLHHYLHERICSRQRKFDFQCLSSTIKRNMFFFFLFLHSTTKGENHRTKHTFQIIFISNLIIDLFLNFLNIFIYLLYSKTNQSGGTETRRARLIIKVVWIFRIMICTMRKKIRICLIVILLNVFNFLKIVFKKH